MPTRPTNISVVVSRIRNGFIVSDNDSGTVLSEAVYCKTAKEIGEAALSVMAKQKLFSEENKEPGVDAQMDLFNNTDNTISLTK